MNRRFREFAEVRYVVLSAGVLAIALLHTINQQWSGDFWEHAAVVRELSRRPWSPLHPLFAVDAPHPFMSPHALLTALAARLTGTSAVVMLATVGMINVVALLVGLKLFATALIGWRGSFYALLFSLFFWGPDPWRYSGFIHLNALGFVIAYPSIAALALTLVCLYAMLRYFETSRRGWVLLLTIGSAYVLLTHPITAIVLAAGFVALSIRELVRRPRAVLSIGMLVALTSLLAVLLWPYYPWLSLITTGSDVYAEPNRAMYVDVGQRTWPLLLALPALVGRWRKDALDPLVFFVTLLCVLYGTGAVLENGPLGRVLPALALALHVTLAGGVATLEQRWITSKKQRALWLLYAAVALAVIAGAANMAPGLLRAVPRALLPASLAADARLERIPDIYSPLTHDIGGDDVVMADLNFSRYMPAFAGKVVAFIDPEAFIADQAQRREAVTRFFANITADERMALLDRYNARFVAIDRRQAIVPEDLRRSLSALGRVVRDDHRLLLIERRTQ